MQRRYDELVEEARSRIPALAPEWTDHNPSDPGVALIELLAWVSEQVIYRAGRVPLSTRRAFLGLLRGEDPDARLSAAEVDAALTEALRELRTPYRVVTAEDVQLQLREHWPSTSEAQALGLERRVGVVEVVPRRDLSAADPDAERPAHLSVIAGPWPKSWSFSGEVSSDAPQVSFHLDAAATVQLSTTVPCGAQLFGSVQGALLAELEDLEPGASVSLSAAELGETGDFRLRLSPSAQDFTLTLTAAGAARSVHPKANILDLVDRFMPARRPCTLRALASCEDPTLELKLEILDPGGAVRTTATGAGTLAARVEVSAERLASTPGDWRVRLRATSAAQTQVRLHVDAVERPAAWDEGGDPLLDALWRFLDERRLLTVRHHVLPPQSLRVAVDAALYLAPQAEAAAVRRRATEALRARFALPGGAEPGWPLGRDVHRTDVYACLEAVPGVDFVESLTLSAPDQSGRAQVLEGETWSLRVEATEQVDLDLKASSFTLYERR